jgi:two-component system sensor histidine kinase MprB
MSLRARMGLAAGVAVALAVVAVALSAYAGTRSELRGQVDDELQQRMMQELAPPRGGGGPPGNRGFFFGGGAASGGDCDGGRGTEGGPQPFGGPTSVIQFVTPAGLRCGAGSGATRLPIDAQTKRIAAAGRGRAWRDVTINGIDVRVLASGAGPLGAVQIALPLTDANRALSDELLLFAVIAAAGVALAALLGVAVARTALAPIARFTRRTESIATQPDLSQRLEVEGDDELARLARTFNATLAALERSVDAQRNLVADASHELRTPIATLRANLQLMRDETRLTQADRDALREDMIEELDELTGLVADVVELARGSKPTGEADDVRLDEIATDAGARTQRRATDLVLELELEPTLVHGEPERIARAVMNLLDNARKWSPAGGTVEVTLEHGVLSVRDHGPGFNDDDLPFVFDRFHRARDARSKPGSGLGLAIVRQAAEAHGGFARASNAPGGGALLEVSFGPATLVVGGSEPGLAGSQQRRH